MKQKLFIATLLLTLVGCGYKTDFPYGEICHLQKKQLEHYIVQEKVIFLYDKNCKEKAIKIISQHTGVFLKVDFHINELESISNVFSSYKGSRKITSEVFSDSIIYLTDDVIDKLIQLPVTPYFSDSFIATQAQNDRMFNNGWLGARLIN